MESLTKHPDSREACVLVADDQPDVLKALRLVLKNEGFKVATAASAGEILDAVKTQDLDIVVMDLNYTRGAISGKEGLDLLSRIQEIDAALPVVVMTAWSSVELAVEAMRRGARDFLPKPWKNERLLAIVRTQVELGQALRKSRRLEEENRLLRDEASRRFIAESKPMQSVLQMLEKVAPSDANILITGESGTGKGLLARVLHEMSSRPSRSLVTLDIGALPASVIESELFGHVKGAFTDAKSDRLGRFELADGGTLFLDEIANIPLTLQSKLLRVLETGEFEPVGSSKTRHANTRIISASNANLDQEVAEGRFRQDLLYRLNAVRAHLPPLRERRDDIPVMAQHFRNRHALHYRKSVTNFDPAAMQALLGHSWPGNVRELDHVVERAVLMASGELIRIGDLSLGAVTDGARTLDGMSLEEVEKALIQKAMARYGGNVREAAEALGLSRSALYRRFEKYGL